MSLHILIGTAASGKSTWAKEHADYFDDTIILSSDDFREVICGNVADQSKNNTVFETLRYNCEYFLKQGFNVIIDATNVSKWERKGYLDIARKLNKEANAVYFKVSIDEAKSRNAGRKRVVPESVIDKQYSRLEIPDYTEFKNILVVEN